MRRFLKSLLGFLALFALCAVPVQAADTVLAVLSFMAAQRNVEFLKFNRMMPVYKQNGIAPSLLEYTLFSERDISSDQLYQTLKGYHVVALSTTDEGVYKLGPKERERAKNVGAALARYVQEGGGLCILAQAVRYPGSDDEAYWNLVFEPLGATILHEGCYDPTRSYDNNFYLGKKTYWFTRNVTPHPVTEGVERLFLPLNGFGSGPGLVAMRYSPEWQIVAAGEKEAKSFKSGQDNIIHLDQPGSYTSVPPVVAVRQFGRGRVVSFPLAPIYTGQNYNNPLWKNVVETAGNIEAGLSSDGLKLLMNSYRWAGEPAKSVAGFGTHTDPPYAPVVYPPKVDWDKSRFEQVTAHSGVRGVYGARTVYGGGTGTVAEYVQAAKAAGLSFIVFNDPLERLTADTLAKLKAECAAASDDTFYACPGIEFTDGIGNRWAFWGEKVVYPPTTFKDKQWTFTLWDGKRIYYYGRYQDFCGFSPSALIDYNELRANGAHAENLWWFYHYLPLVYDRGKLIANNYNDFLHGLRDMRWAALASYTRMYAPSEVRAAAQTLFTGFKDLPAARAGLNTRCTAYWAAESGREYVSQGPEIVQWQAFNSQMENNWKVTRGAQRVRLRFTVRSAIGIADVQVRDAESGLMRRFLGNGAKELSREFEVVQDKQHYLTLDVTDTAGKKAYSWYQLIYAYKQGFFRCGDNLNTLSSTGLTFHPDRNELLPQAKPFENGMDYGLVGWDSAGFVCPMPRTWALDNMAIDKGYYPEFQVDGAVGKILDVALGSYNIQIATQRMTQLSEPYDNAKRPGPALCTVARDLGPLTFERTHTMYAPMTRTDFYTSMNHQRPREGTKDYRGGLIWHEGTIRFTKDTVLRGTAPIRLVRMTCPTDVREGWGQLLIVKEDEKTPRVSLLRNDKSTIRQKGLLRSGGYISQMPSSVGYEAFLVPQGGEFSYDASLPGYIYIGLGHDGQVVKAGTEFTYRYAIGSFADPDAGNAMIEDTVRALNFAGGNAGYPVTMTAGAFVDGLFFGTFKAAQHEMACTIGPREMIIDLPIRVQGLEDNGCAAVYSKARPWFRFISVVQDTAYFQEPVAPVNDLWVGNVFVCDQKAVKLCLVMDGQADGKKPFLEAHNPTDAPLDVSITSPAHTPLFGGMTARTRIPAGDSIRLEIDGGKLVEMK